MGATDRHPRRAAPLTPAGVGRPMTTAAMAHDTDDPTRRILELLRQGRSDGHIARRLGIDREEVRARIDAVIRAARLDENGRIDVLAARAGIVPRDD